MAESRKGELLEKAAGAFNDQRDPFSTDWLADNHVTADECFDLSQNIATLLYGYLGSPSEVQQQVMLIGACTASGMSPEDVTIANDQLRMSKVTKALGANPS